MSSTELGVQGVAEKIPTRSMSLSIREYTAFSLDEGDQRCPSPGERFKYYRGEEEDIHGFS